MSDLTPLPGREDLLVYRKRPGILAGHEKFYLTTPLLYFDPASVEKGVDPDELKQLALFLRSEILSALEEQPSSFQVVEEAGPGVLVVRSAITGVEPADPKRGIGTSAGGLVPGVGVLVPRGPPARSISRAPRSGGSSGRLSGRGRSSSARASTRATNASREPCRCENPRNWASDQRYLQGGARESDVEGDLGRRGARYLRRVDGGLGAGSVQE
jgi:hypothetical protein